MSALLEREVAAYTKAKPDLLASDTGRWVLVHGDKIEGVFDSQTAALSAGYEKHGNTPFLVRQVSQTDQVGNYVSGHIAVA